jgi:hypothetical protein
MEFSMLSLGKVVVKGGTIRVIAVSGIMVVIGTLTILTLTCWQLATEQPLGV